jgi:hypothetical protein
MKPTDQVILDSVRQWFEQAVLCLNLCPFAHQPFQQGRVRFELSFARDDVECLTDLFMQLQALDRDTDVETTILVIPYHLARFTDYNQFLSLAEQLLQQEGWEGVYQLASFHPDYRFAGSKRDARSNWTNRSPFPLLHLIREDSLSRALNSMSDPQEIPRRNVRRIKALNDEEMQRIFGRRCIQQADRGKRIPD